MFLAAAADRRRSPRHITEILDNMTELYTAAGSVFFGAEYANHDGRHERRDITQPCLCVYGTTHAAALLERPAVGQRRGRLARPLHHPAAPRTTIPRRRSAAASGPHRSISSSACVVVAAGGGRAASGNLAGLGAGTTTSIEPMTVRRTPEAAEAFRDLASDVTQRAARGARHRPRPRSSRASARMPQKLALIAAVSRDPVAPAIQAADAEWSMRLRPALCVAALMRAVDRHVADNEIERNHKKMLDIIRCGRSQRPDAQRADPQDAVPRSPNARRGAADPDRGGPRQQPDAPLRDASHRRPGGTRGRSGMNCFNPRRNLSKRGISDKRLFWLWRIRIFQIFNLSRGRIHTTRAHANRWYLY